ncbi:MAG TPA: protelomerase family protein [Allocoleopsis sp.]
MAHRKWLAHNLETDYLPEIERIGNKPKQLSKLCASMRAHWADRGLSSLSAQGDCMAQVRRAIKDKFGDAHLSLKHIDLSREEYIQLNNQRQESVGSRNEAVQFLDDPEAIVSTAVRLLESPEWAEVAAGLSVLTGRRCSELLATAQFSIKSKWSVVFTGALKRRSEEIPLSFEIPTLTTAEKVCKALAKIRKALPQAQDMSPNAINGKFAPAVSTACDRHFTGLIPTRAGEDSLYTHLFRSVYATIAVFWYCPPSVNEVEFKATIQGHYQILNEHNPQQRRSIAASRHYSDFEIADSVVARYNGKRKGIKLGLGGVEVIEAFKQALIASDLPAPAPKRPRSTVRIYQEDKPLLEALFDRLEVSDQGTQADRLHALILWASEHLETLQAAPVVPVIPEVAPPVQAEESQPQDEEVLLQAEMPPIAEEFSAPASPLEQKLDQLVSVMQSFVQLQLQPQLHSPSPSSRLPKAQKSSSAPTPRASASLNTDRLNHAIDAIFAWNNTPDRSHDDKWAITINVLKAFVKSQPRIMAILEQRKDEIAHHHAQHQINPSSHNYRHRGKHKIEDVIAID